MIQKATMFSVIMINACLYAADNDNMPPIIPFKTSRDAVAVARMIELDYDHIVGLGDSLKERNRHIGVLLERYAKSEMNQNSSCKQLVMREDEKTVGFVDFMFSPPLTRFGVPRGNIIVLAVDQEYRGKSYGAHLCNHACTVLQNRGAHRIKLMTTTEEVWRHFYKHLGFKPNGSMGKFNPTYFYYKELVPPRSWATIARLVVNSVIK
jgi:ribosomal protein S18 acetylase RimI-like enzyme